MINLGPFPWFITPQLNHGNVQGGLSWVITPGRQRMITHDNLPYRLDWSKPTALLASSLTEGCIAWCQRGSDKSNINENIVIEMERRRSEGARGDYLARAINRVAEVDYQGMIEGC